MSDLQPPRPARVLSDKRIDLRTVVIPPKIWQPQQTCSRKSADKEGKVVGFLRVSPDMNLKTVRTEFQIQLEETMVPTDYVFLRCVGDFLTLVSKKQEQTLKAKSYAPPYTSTPDVYVLSTECLTSQAMTSIATADRITSPLISPMSPDPKEFPQEQPVTAGAAAVEDRMLVSPTSPFPNSLNSDDSLRAVSKRSDSIPQVSISLSPTPTPQPPSQPRDPALPRRSPRSGRKRKEVQPTADNADGLSYAMPVSAAPEPNSTSLLLGMLREPHPLSGSERFTVPTPQGGTSRSPSRSRSTSPLPPLDVDHHRDQVDAGHHTVAGTTAPLQLYLNQGMAGDLSLQFGGQGQPGGDLSLQFGGQGQPGGDLSLQFGGQGQPGGLSSGHMPRVDIRIASPSPFNKAQPLPPLGSNSAEESEEEDMEQEAEPEASLSPLPPATNDIFAAREASQKAHQQELDELKAKLAALKGEIEPKEQYKRELHEKSQSLEKELHRKQAATEEEWKKKYLQEKRRTIPLENKLDELRKKFADLHNKPAQQRGRQAMKDPKGPSEANNNRAMFQRQQKEIERLRQREETLRNQLEAEQKARAQMAQECKQLREELMDKKITKTLIKKP
ncbi:coiled-coil domain-containing protein 86-like isoform X2 [Sycon ciliatum]|uniref:coiled-coil domain-containing protein 86-like isoform X2 n=1 Tax=Sycon ciliatum TaxID=27933 RepID=UPI0031F6ECAF